MATPRHLNHAPITEALIDLRVTPSTHLTADILRQVAESVRAQYPEMAERRGMKMSLEFNAGGPTAQSAADLGIDGYLCRSADKRIVVQFRADGFTFNRLQPYTSWRDIIPEALRLYRLYAAATKATVIRVAVRYINQIKIPDEVEDLREFLTYPPSAPLGSGQVLSTFLSRVTVYDQGTQASAVVMQAIDPSLDPAMKAVLLDIAAFKVKPNDVSFSPDEVEPTLEVLHNMKNDVFFGSVTDEALRPYL